MENREKNMKKGVLLISPFFSPNIGGVETHLDDLVLALDRRGYSVFVQTYSPIITEGVSWKAFGKRHRNVEIRRYRWFGKRIFNKIEKKHLLDFLYLTPYLFLRTFLWLLLNSKKVDVIHAQGFNAAWIGVVLKKIFRKKLIVSTHAIYEIDKKSCTAKRIVSILSKADEVLCLSQGSYNELASFGLAKEKMNLFKYWINLDSFRILDKQEFRSELQIEDKFTVLFVGRLIEKKGMKVLAEVAKQVPEINFLFIGTGPEENYLKQQAIEHRNIKFIGMVKNTQLYRYYNVADIFCIPSQYEEGFGRVVMEAVACGLPVVGANKGGIPEALDNTVSVLVDPTVENLKNSIEELYKNKEKYLELRVNCRRYAEKNFSEENIDLITKYY